MCRITFPSAPRLPSLLLPCTLLPSSHAPIPTGRAPLGRAGHCTKNPPSKRARETSPPYSPAYTRDPTCMPWARRSVRWLHDTAAPNSARRLATSEGARALTNAPRVTSMPGDRPNTPPSPFAAFTRSAAASPPTHEPKTVHRGRACGRRRTQRADSATDAVHRFAPPRPYRQDRKRPRDDTSPPPS